MRFSEINARYTAIVTDWMARGYIINAGTMSGSQGEIAHIDLTNGQEIIRVLLELAGGPFAKIGDRRYNTSRVVLRVGRCTDRVIPNSGRDYGTVWNEHLEELSREEFYRIGTESRHNGYWYGTREEAMAQQDLSSERYSRRNVETDRVFDSDAARQIVLPFVRRQNNCRSVRAAEISQIARRVNPYTGDIRYTVTARNHNFRLR